VKLIPLKLEKELAVDEISQLTLPAIVDFRVNEFSALTSPVSSDITVNGGGFLVSRTLSSKQSFNLPETHQGAYKVGDQNNNNKSYDVGHGLLPSTYKYD
jgi:hypothetical protein